MQPHTVHIPCVIEVDYLLNFRLLLNHIPLISSSKVPLYLLQIEMSNVTEVSGVGLMLGDNEGMKN